MHATRFSFEKRRTARALDRDPSGKGVLELCGEHFDERVQVAA